MGLQGVNGGVSIYGLLSVVKTFKIDSFFENLVHGSANRSRTGIENTPSLLITTAEVVQLGFQYYKSFMFWGFSSPKRGSSSHTWHTLSWPMGHATKRLPIHTSTHFPLGSIEALCQRRCTLYTLLDTGGTRFKSVQNKGKSDFTFSLLKTLFHTVSKCFIPEKVVAVLKGLHRLVTPCDYGTTYLVCGTVPNLR